MVALRRRPAAAPTVEAEAEHARHEAERRGDDEQQRIARAHTRRRRERRGWWPGGMRGQEAATVVAAAAAAAVRRLRSASADFGGADSPGSARPPRRRSRTSPTARWRTPAERALPPPPTSVPPRSSGVRSPTAPRGYRRGAPPGVGADQRSPSAWPPTRRARARRPACSGGPKRSARLQAREVSVEASGVRSASILRCTPTRCGARHQEEELLHSREDVNCRESVG